MTIPFLAAFSLAEFVPSITRFFGGPKLESITEKIIQIAKQIGDSDDITTVIETFKKDPNKVIDFQRAILSMEADIELSLIKDRQEARQRELNLLLQGKSTYRADIMVISAVLGLTLCLATLGLYGESLPGEAVGIISTIAGIFGACLKDAYAFEFGSSRGSRQKDETMAAMVDQL